MPTVQSDSATQYESADLVHLHNSLTRSSDMTSSKDFAATFGMAGVKADLKSSKVRLCGFFYARIFFFARAYFFRLG